MTDPSQYIAAMEAVMRDRGYGEPRFTDDGLTHSGGVIDDAYEIAFVLGNADVLIQIATFTFCDVGAQYLERLGVDNARRAYQSIKNHSHRHVDLSPECVDEFCVMIGAVSGDDNQSSRT